MFGVMKNEDNKVEGFKDWKFVGGDEKEEDDDDIFDIGDDAGALEVSGFDGDDEKRESEKKEEDRLLEIEEKALSEVLKGMLLHILLHSFVVIWHLIVVECELRAVSLDISCVTV